MLRATLPLLATPALAQVHAPDVDVYRPFGSPEAAEGGAKAFDADWTADGRLALAWVEQGYKGDLLVLAVHDPRSGASEPWRILGKFGAMGWWFHQPNVAVPSVWYGDPQSDRLYVAVTAEAKVQGSGGELTAKGVRLVSISLHGDENEVRVASPPDATPGVTSVYYRPDEPVVALTPESSWSNQPKYMVDLLYRDPDGFHELDWPRELHQGGHLMIARSFDHGRSLSCGVYLTGPKALCLGQAAKDHYANTLDTRVSAAGDGLNGRTWIVVEDMQAGRVDLLSSPYPAKVTDPIEVDLEWESPGPYGAESHPRIACNDEGEYAFTYLTKSAQHADGSDVHWFVGNYYSGHLEMQPLPDRVWSPADIDLRRNDAWITADALVDGGKAAAPAFFDASINDRSAIVPGVLVADGGPTLGAPVAAATPAGTPKRKGTLFRYADGDTKVIWLDE